MANIIRYFKELTTTKNNAELAEIALAHVLWVCLAYENQWYKFENTQILTNN